MTILLTRPLEDSLELTTSLQNAAICSFIEPMFRVEYLAYEDPPTNVDSLIFTSKHALKAIKANLAIPRTVKCFVVGKEVSLYAQRLGFTVQTAESCVSDLVTVLIKNHHKSLLYLRGEIITLDIKRVLQKQNISIQERIVYKTIAAQNLSDTLIAKLKNTEIKAVTLFSKTTAEIFFKLINQYGIENFLKEVTILVVSEDVKSFISKIAKDMISNNLVRVFKNRDHLIDIAKTQL